jgi:sulfite dehydrogenase (cytochrome) subunit B
MKTPTLIAAAAVCGLMSHVARAGEESIQLRQGEGRDLTTARCSVCHSLDYIPMVAPAMNHAAWEKTVHKMVDAFGAPMEPADLDRIVDYLAGQYSSGAEPAK